MIRVSFEVAKALKEAGYPQTTKAIPCYDECGKYYARGGNYTRKQTYDAPFAMEVWLWLWREKKICINCKLDKYNLLPMWWCTNEDDINYITPNFNDPEEAIIAAIECLVDKDLIK